MTGRRVLISNWYVLADFHYQSSLSHSELLKAQTQQEGAVSLPLLAIPRMFYVRRSKHGNLCSRGTNTIPFDPIRTVKKTALGQSAGGFY